MSTRHDIAELSAKLEQLLDMLDQLEKQENRKAALFANGVRHRLAELRRIGSDGNDMRLAMRLLAYHSTQFIGHELSASARAL